MLPRQISTHTATEIKIYGINLENNNKRTALTLRILKYKNQVRPGILLSDMITFCCRKESLHKEIGHLQRNEEEGNHGQREIK